MQSLTPQQIVLLALFVSFVTSIATGIVTVSLLEQAPDPVVQTINQVIEKTVERVVPLDSPIAKIINTPPQKTIVVSDSELSTQAVEKAEKNIVRIYQVDRDNRYFIGLGLVIDNSGRVLVEKNLINKYFKFEAKYFEGSVAIVPDIHLKDESIYAVMKPAGDISALKFEAAVLVDLTKTKLAQQVIAMSGQERTVVSLGNISDLIKDEKGAISRIVTSVDPNGVYIGSTLVDLSGQVLGLSLSTFSQNNFIPVYIPVRPAETK